MGVDAEEKSLLLSTQPSGASSGAINEEAHYSSRDSERQAPTTGFFGSTFLVINASIGAGLLAFPYAFMQAGIVPAILMQLVSAKYFTWMNELLCLEHGYSRTCPVHMCSKHRIL